MAGTFNGQRLVVDVDLGAGLLDDFARGNHIALVTDTSRIPFFGTTIWKGLDAARIPPSSARAAFRGPGHFRQENGCAFPCLAERDPHVSR